MNCTHGVSKNAINPLGKMNIKAQHKTTFVKSEKQTLCLKVYTVEIVPCLSKWWYTNKVGKKFTCILIAKESSDKKVRAVFAVVEKIGDRYHTPGIVRTIRAEDCKVIREEIQLHTNLGQYQKGF